MKVFTYIKNDSTRVLKKNFQELGGKPLWEHLIDELSGCQVYIDTDSTKILHESAKRFKHVIAYARDEEHENLELDGDFAVSPVLLMIDRFLDLFVYDENEVIVTPHVTSPFLKVETIQDAISKLNKDHDSVQACTVHKDFAYYQGSPINFDPKVIQKTQDLDPIIMGNGAFFIFTKKSFKENANRTGKNPFFYPLSFEEAIEIDTYEDLQLARRWINV